MRREHKINVSRKKCIGCGMCVKDCPVNNIRVKDKKAVLKTQSCLMCGHCAAVCPKAAVSITGFSESSVEINGRTVLEPQRLMDAIRTRRSVRQYRQKPVDADIIKQVIEAGRLTPSGENAQNVSYIVLQKEMERYEKTAVLFAKRMLPLMKIIKPNARNIIIDDHFFFKEAPAAILVLAKDKVNAALAASNMELMAEAHGLGVLYSGLFAMSANHSFALRRMLKLRNAKVVTVLVLGYPNVQYHRTVQKEPADVRYL